MTDKVRTTTISRVLSRRIGCHCLPLARGRWVVNNKTAERIRKLAEELDSGRVRSLETFGRAAEVPSA